MSQVPFSLLEVLDKDLLDIGAMVGTAPTSSRCGVVARQGQLLATGALKGCVRRVPLVGSSKGGFVDLVVSFDPFSNFHHSLSL
jgi:hypothetical protein